MVSLVGSSMVNVANAPEVPRRPRRPTGSARFGGQRLDPVDDSLCYMDAALQELRSEGFEVKTEHVARLSPLTSKHFHMLGRYHFHASEAVLRGELRPLRDPEKMDDELLIA